MGAPAPVVDRQRAAAGTRGRVPRDGTAAADGAVAGSVVASPSVAASPPGRRTAGRPGSVDGAAEAGAGADAVMSGAERPGGRPARGAKRRRARSGAAAPVASVPSAPSVQSGRDGAAAADAPAGTAGTPARPLTPRDVLRCVQDGSWETLPQHVAAAARLFGASAAAAGAVARTTRSGSVASASSRAAVRSLALVVSPDAADAAAGSSEQLNEVVDEWLAQAVLVVCRAKGVDWASQLQQSLIPDRMSLMLKPRAARNEFGALQARIERCRRQWSFPQLRAALDAVAASGPNRGPAAHRSPRNPLWPREVYAFLESRAWKGARARTLSAALAAGASLGMPITLTRMIEVEHVSVMRDVDKQPGIALQVPPRPQGRKTHRHRAVEGDDVQPTSRTAAAGPLVAKYVVPWYRYARDKGARYLFPKFGRCGDDFDGTEMIGERMLRDALYEVRGADVDRPQWHDLRRGLEHAVDRVHEVPGGPKAPVAEEVKNALTLRSNLRCRGSRDTYIHDSALRLFEATRVIHRVEATLEGGLVAHGGVERAVDDAPFDGTCAWCEATLDKETGTASMCDHDGCLWSLCPACWDRPVDEPLFCPEHEPTVGSDVTPDDGE